MSLKLPRNWVILTLGGLGCPKEAADNWASVSESTVLTTLLVSGGVKPLGVATFEGGKFMELQVG